MIQVTTGNFTTFNLPALTGLVWKTGGLVADGTLRVSTGLDAAAPKVSILGPGAKQRLPNTNATFGVWGTASDKGSSGLAGVSWSVNGGGAHAATLTSGVGVSNWTADVPLVAGMNNFLVWGRDNDGNVTAVPRLLYLIVEKQVFFHTNGATGLIPAVDKFGRLPTNGAMLEVTVPYTVTVIPTANFVYSNTVVTNATQTNTITLQKVTFIMQTNTHVFFNVQTNRFLVAGGTYNGLFYDTNTNCR